MKMRYFFVDSGGQLRKASQAAVRALWNRERRATELGCPDPDELRLISVACDGDLLPRKVYLLRLPLAQGWFSLESELRLQMHAQADLFPPEEAVRHHLEGWPRDLGVQLAVALDVPQSHLAGVMAVGGPLFEAAARRLTPAQALRFLR
jgi:hypothetical protein